MRTRSFFCLVVFFLGFMHCGLNAQKVWYKENAEKKISVPVEIFDGIVYLKVLLNDEYEGRFILDTGTDSVSVVSNGLALKMGVLGPEPISAPGLKSRKNRVRRLYGTRLGVGDAVFIGYDFISLPLDRLEPYWGRKIEGILGGNILKDFVLTIEYEKKSLSMTDHVPAEIKRTGYRLPISVMGSTPIVEAQLIIKRETAPLSGRFIVDTGVRQSLVNTPFTERYNLLEQSGRTIVNITGYGIGGLIVERLGRIAYLNFGGARLKNPVLQMSVNKEGLRTSDLFDGIIGGDLLSRFTVVLDYPDQTLYLAPNGSFGDPFLYDMSGIYFTMESDVHSTRVRVVNVVDESPAAKSGVKKGDIILEIDDQSADAFSMPAMKTHFKREGKTVKLKLDRDGKKLSLVLFLEPYL